MAESDDKKPARKISLNQQIEEVRREVKKREQVYPRIASSGGERQSVLDYQMERMQAVVGTLEWLQVNEDKIRVKLLPPPAGPYIVVERSECFTVEAAADKTVLGHFYFEDEPGRRREMKRMTKAVALQMATIIAETADPT